MRHRRLSRLLCSLPPVLLLAAAGCGSGHGSAHVGSIPADDFRSGPIDRMGPGAAFEYMSGSAPGSAPGSDTPGSTSGAPGNGNPGPLAPGKGGSGRGSGSKGGTSIRIGKSG